MHSISEKEERPSEKNDKEQELSDDLDESDSESVDFQLNEHIDCRDSVNKWLDAEIIAVFFIISQKCSIFINIY